MNLVKIHSTSTLQIIPDSGHVCNVEQPELFNQWAIDFIQKSK